MQLLYQSYNYEVKQKNKNVLISCSMYPILRSILFMFSAEKAHHLSMNALKLTCSTSIGRKLIRSMFNGPAERVEVCGLQFKNRLGLAAGFDKNAHYLRELECLGFGHVEIGTVTPLAQSGNEKPRLFRLKKDYALINRMGFNNEGVAEVKKSLIHWRATHPESKMIIGGNIGKNKITENEYAWKDYAICFQELYPHVDYFTVNVSSPNTPGLRALQDVDALKVILGHLITIRDNFQKYKPVFLKIAPDLSDEQALKTAELVKAMEIDGMIIANTTIQRSNLKTTNDELETIGAGGLSGIPVRERAQSLLKFISEKMGKEFCIIGSGGIFSKQDAQQRLDAGAQLIQIWTGFIYEGPSIIKKITSK